MAKCKELIRNPITGLDPTPCGLTIVNNLCSNRVNHVQKYRTGFCIDGHCEGTEHKTGSGRYQKTCSFWLTCPCKCHTEISSLYAMLNEERRIPIQKYVPEHHDFVMPSLEEYYTQRELDRQAELVVIKNENPELPDRVVKHTEPPSPVRTRRGQLEELVQECLDDWVKSGKMERATTGYVSSWIARKYEIPEPSRGAIDSIYKRWDALGFAVIAPKPNRFAGYTSKGRRLGLQVLKSLQKKGGN